MEKVHIKGIAVAKPSQHTASAFVQYLLEAEQLLEAAQKALDALVREALRLKRAARDEVRVFEDRDEVPPKERQLSLARAEARAAALLDAWKAVVGEPYSTPVEGTDK
jgi:hypothetical protein